MAAGDFTLTPTWVYPEARIFHNIVSQSESMKREYLNVSVTGVERFVLRYEGMTDANFETLFEHYNARYGGYGSFAWKNANIPLYIIDVLDLGASDLTGRWVDGSFKFVPQSHSWNAEIMFEKAI